jgi:predicted transcriptional regulator
MAFSLTLVNHTPPLGSEDVDAVASALLRDIGYLPGGLEVPHVGRPRRRGRPRRGAMDGLGTSDPARPGSEVLESIPYRLFVGCLLERPDHGFTIEELERELTASRPTIYRHLNKLRDMELLSHVDGGSADDGGRGASPTSRRRRYGLRFGSLSRAWRFAELGAECALEGLRERVDAVWGEYDRRRGGADRQESQEGERDRTRSRVDFRLVLQERGPLERSSGTEGLLREMLLAIGYISEGRAAPDAAAEVTEGIAWRLFDGCLLKRPDRTWTIEQLMAKLDTSRPTVYRHVHKLEALDLLEHTLLGGSPRSLTGMRLRYGDLSVAWNFAEEHARASLAAYGQTVGHLEALTTAGRPPKGR